MDQGYDFKENETKAQKAWENASCFQYEEKEGRPVFSMFLVPPNASGPLHVGNALMLALQDILARYHRARGDNTLWVPSLDHGGYETQITYEREREQKGVHMTREEFRPDQLYTEIHDFVEEQKHSIIDQIKTLGASVDWSRLRYTLDDESIAGSKAMFAHMTNDGAISRRAYMMNYCPICSTVLADVELKKDEVVAPAYHVTFQPALGGEPITVVTTTPEFLFSVTHLLVHPEDKRFASFIGKQFINPCTGQPVDVVASKRKLSWHQEQSHLTPFCPSFVRYDYEYAIRNGLPSEDYFDWDGKLTARYPGLSLREAREKEVEHLKSVGVLIETTEGNEETTACKKGHDTVSLIRHGWFLNIDENTAPIRQRSMEALKKQPLDILPFWRKKGLVDWVAKMTDWPISRQNVWGIRMPVYYEVANPADFLVWFFDSNNERQFGSLESFLHAGHTLEEIQNGLQRVYAAEHCTWTLTPEEGKQYLPETDTFDTWFSSAAWRVFSYGPLADNGRAKHYPSDVHIVGYDLLRTAVARQIILSTYLAGKLPFRSVYFHSLLLGPDGQKMSKSIGNVVSLDEYVATYGADVTRMALVSYTGKFEDFVFEDARLKECKDFVGELWRIAQGYNVLLAHGLTAESVARLNDEDFTVIRDLQQLGRAIGKSIEQQRFADAQQKVVAFLPQLAGLVERVVASGDTSAAAAFLRAFKDYLVVLHPFAPHVTEAIYQGLSDHEPGKILAAEAWVQTHS